MPQVLSVSRLEVIGVVTGLRPAAFRRRQRRGRRLVVDRIKGWQWSRALPDRVLPVATCYGPT